MEIIEYRYRDGGIRLGHEVVYGPGVSWWDVMNGRVDVEEVMREAVSEYRRDFPGGGVVHPWWQGVEGDWVLADDGRILRVMAVGGFGGEGSNSVPGGRRDPRSRGWVRTVIGTFPLPRPGRPSRVMMDTDVRWHPDRYKLGQTVPGTYVDPRGRGSLRVKRREVEGKALRMVRAIVTGMDAWDAYLLYFGRKGSSAYLEARFNKVIQSKAFMDTMDRVVRGLAEDAGVGQKAVLDRYKQLLDVTMEGIDAKGKDFKQRADMARNLLDDLSRINGLKPVAGVPMAPVLPMMPAFGSPQKSVTQGAIERIESVKGRFTAQDADAEYDEVTTNEKEQGHEPEQEDTDGPQARRAFIRSRQGTIGPGCGQ